MRVRTLIALGAVAAAGGAAIWVWRHSGRETESSAQPSASSRPGAQTRPACALTPRARFALSGQASIDTSLDLGRLLRETGQQSADRGVGVRATPAQRVTETRRFTVDFEVLEASAQGPVLGARIRDLSGTVDGDEVDVAEPGVDSAFRIQLDERCGIRSFGWKGDAQLDGARQQQSLVASLSFQLPAERDGERYESTGFDATGVYRARNQLVDGALVSRILRYQRLYGDGADQDVRQPSVRIERALLHVRFEDGTWLAKAQRTLLLSFLMRSTTVGSMSLEASFHSTSSASPPGLAHGGEWIWGNLLDRPSAAVGAQPPAGVDQKISKMTLTQALAEASRQIKDPSGNPADYVVLLADWMRAHPEAVPELVEQIRTDELHGQSRLQAALFHAMAAANTPATRAALDTIFKGEDFAYGRRIDAAQVAALLSPPLDGFLEALTHEATSGPESFDRGSMQLALGMFAASHALEHPEQAAEARAAIGGIIERAGSDETALVHGLQAAGNAASDELHPAIAAHLEDERALVREAAADAMRNLSGDVALPSVDERLAREQDPAVRARLIDTATTVVRRDGRAPPPSLLAEVSKDAAGTTSGGSFGRAVDLLGIAAEAGSGEARRHLVRLFKAETDKGTGKDAARLERLGRYVGTRWTRR